MPTQGSSTTTTTTRNQPKDGPRPAENMTKQQPQAKQVEHKRFIKRYRTEVAASGSSVLSTLATFPLDSVKTRMQTYKYSGFVDCVRHTYETEKLRGFFRGKWSLDPSLPDLPPQVPSINYLIFNPSSSRCYCPSSKHHSRPNRILFDLPTIQICLLGLAQEKLWYRCARPCQQERDVSEPHLGCLFRCGGCYGWFLYYIDRVLVVCVLYSWLARQADSPHRPV